MITGMDRLVAAAEGRPCDRIPVFCNLFDQGAKELGMSREVYFSRGEHVAEAQLRMREKYGYDNLWSLFYVGKEAELLGCRKISFSEQGSPNVEDFVLKTAEDIRRLRIPDDVAALPAFKESAKCAEILRREAGGKYPICAYVTSAMTLPSMLMGMEKWMELLFLGPTGLRDELLAKCSEFFAKELAAYRAAGADTFVYSNSFGSLDFVPKKFFEEVSLPWIERDLAGAEAQGVVYYCGGARVNGAIERVLERTGIGAYYLGPDDDVAEAKRLLAGRGLAAGIINDIRLLDWSRKEIRAEVKRIVSAGMPGGRFAFGTLGMPYGIPEENIRTMLEAAYEFGSYGA